MNLIIKFAPLIFLIFMSTSVFAKEYSNAVNPKFVADTSKLETEGIIKLGVLFKIEPGWHIYWKNSGDSGLPTKVSFELPEGFSAGELFWPIPNAYERSGSILDYGYEDQVLLWTDVNVPTEYDKNVPIPVNVNAKWVSCEEICIPGKATLEAKITPGEKNDNNELFQNWEKTLPVKNEKIDSNVKELKINPGHAKYTITLYFPEPVQDIKFFPVTGKSVKIDDISYFNKDGNTQEISFELSAYQGKSAETDKLDSIIAYTDSKNVRRGIEFPINIYNLHSKN